MPIAKKGLLGVHCLTIVDIATKEPVSILKVVDTANIDLGETVAVLKGGDSNHPYSAAVVDANHTVSIPVKEFPDSFVELLYRATQTPGAAEAAGNISTPANVTGTSIVSATTGITATITATSGSTLKEGTYIIKAASATTLNIYGYTSYDDLTMSNDESGLVNATPYTITTGTAANITEIGITVTGGSGTIGFTENDTAIVVVRRINSGILDTPIGDKKNNDYYKAYLYFTPTPEGDMDYIELYRVMPSRGAHSAAVRDYHSQEMTLTVTKDPANNNHVGKWHKTKG